MTLLDNATLEECESPDKDPVHSETLWFFWDESWANRHGPYKTRKDAEEALNRYLHWLETGEELPAPGAVSDPTERAM